MTMLERAREFSRTIVIVLHDINFAARYASDLCPQDGTVAFIGTLEEIMRGVSQTSSTPPSPSCRVPAADCLLFLSVHARRP